MQNKRTSYPYKNRSYNRGSRGPYRGPQKVWKHKYNKNEYIRGDRVQVIDQSGENIGEMDKQEAIALAKQADLDLVEVSPNVQPPVCKIMSWSKFLYELKKKEKKARKNKQKEQKEFRFGTFIAEGDKQRHIKRAMDFLCKGHNVKITVTRRGRTPVEQSKALLQELLTALSEYSTIGSDPVFERKRISIVFKGDPGKEKTKSSSNTDAKAKDTKDSSKEVQENKTPGRKGSEDSVQQKQTGAPEDKKVESKEK